MHRVRAFTVFSLAAALLLSAPGCKPPERPAAAAAPPAEVAVSRAIERDVTPFLEYTGTTAPLQEVEVRARVTGFLDKMLVQPRDIVEPNQPIFAIDARPFKLAVDSAAAQLESLQAQLTKAEFDAQKIAELYARGVASIDEFTKETANRDGLRASVAGAEARLADARLKLDWCTVGAPIAGRISRNLIDPGNIVMADTTVLANIVNDAQINVYFNASEQDILKLRAASREKARREGSTATSQPDIRALKWPAYIGLMTEDGHPHEGIIDYVAPSMDSSTGTLQVRAAFENKDGILLAGLFVRVRVPVSDPTKALMVNERALGSDQGQRYLLVVNDQNVVEYRPVKVGLLDKNLRVIEEGLSSTDRIIVTGIQRVRPGLTVKPVDVPMPTGPATAAGKPAATAPAAATRPSGH